MSNIETSHKKHPAITKTTIGSFGRLEIAIMGTHCQAIRQWANLIAEGLQHRQISYLDAEHKSSYHDSFASIEMKDKINHQQFTCKNPLLAYQQKQIFNEQDLVLINGNHFTGTAQIVVIDETKPLDKKVAMLTNVQLIIKKKGSNHLPDCLKAIPGIQNVPFIHTDDESSVIAFIEEYIKAHTAPLNGLVLAGGQSLRMKKDKALIPYHGMAQQDYVYKLLSDCCRETFISVNATGHSTQNPVISDSFLHLGPMSGILSAFQQNPNAAWLVVACDLPLLSSATIHYLVKHRNSSAIATAFINQDGDFPEPLITIWEPKSYPVLLHFLSMGFSCPRKVLINSNVTLLPAPDIKELTNVNYPEEMETIMTTLKPSEK